MRVAAFRRIHSSRSWKVETVRTVLEKRVFMMPMSKKIFEMTGMDVMATPIVNTSPNEISFPISPIKASLNMPMNGSAPSIGSTVAPKKTHQITRPFERSSSSRVL